MFPLLVFCCCRPPAVDEHASLFVPKLQISGAWWIVYNKNSYVERAIVIWLAVDVVKPTQVSRTITKYLDDVICSVTDQLLTL